MPQDPEAKKKAMAKIISKAWSDPEFKQQLIENPKKILKDHGVELPDEITVKVVADTETTHHILIPSQEEELTEEKLSGLAGGLSSECADSL